MSLDVRDFRRLSMIAHAADDHHATWQIMNAYYYRLTSGETPSHALAFMAHVRRIDTEIPDFDVAADITSVRAELAGQS